jgi:hypothetical protein
MDRHDLRPALPNPAHQKDEMNRMQDVVFIGERESGATVARGNAKVKW